MSDESVVYFGKGCKYFICLWDSENDLPGLTFCKHTENKDNRKGNCNSTDCPGKLTVDNFKIWYQVEENDR